MDSGRLRDNSGFRLFLFVRFFITIATQMQTVAIGWQVYAITGSLLSLGTVGLLVFIPFFICSFFSGDFVDRHERKKIMLVGLGLNILTVAALIGNSLLVKPDITGIYLILLVIGATRAFVGPATSTLLPSIVAPKQLSQAIALNSTTWQVATIIGPAAGGFIYDWAAKAVGVADDSARPAAVVYMACGAVFCACLPMLWKLKAASVIHANKELFWKRFQEGFKYVFHRKILFAAISLDLFAVLLGGAVALLPAVAKDMLNAGPEAMGLLRSASSLGAAAVAIYLSFRPMRERAGVKMLVAVFIFGAATIGFGLTNSIWLSFFFLTVIGASDMISVIVRQSLIQLNTPDHLRGRVSAVSQVFIGASNELGEFESGATAEWFGLQRAIVLGGMGTCAIALLWGRCFPSLRNADTLEEQPEARDGKE